MFAKSFVWGAASSSYQIEGSHNRDSRDSSIWDVFCKRPAAVHLGESGDTACDHYRRVREDVRLFQNLGLQAYRFSISWSRIMRLGRAEPNKFGLDFYDLLVDLLLEAGIEPWITLFHWDMPQSMFHQGGWLNRDSSMWFADYATAVASRLADRVVNWITLNEPQVYISLGHRDGKHAPGLQLGLRECLLASHNTLLAHGNAVQALRSVAKRPIRVGWAPVGHVSCPENNTSQDIDAAKTAMFSVYKQDFWNNTWFGDPICLGHYPVDGLELFRETMPKIENDDLKTICQPIDFYGVNIYSGQTVRFGDPNPPVSVQLPPGAPITAFRWSVLPSSLYWGPKFLYERYRLPIVITENGMSNVDYISNDGHVKDPQRIEFTRRYLLELERAIADGTEVLGYFHWSVMDNFEWAEGYSQRFGLVYIDYVSLQRTLKDSAHWYKSVISSHGSAIHLQTSRLNVERKLTCEYLQPSHPFIEVNI